MNVVVAGIVSNVRARLVKSGLVEFPMILFKLTSKHPAGDNVFDCTMAVLVDTENGSKFDVNIKEGSTMQIQGELHGNRYITVAKAIEPFEDIRLSLDKVYSSADGRDVDYDRYIQKEDK